MMTARIHWFIVLLMALAVFALWMAFDRAFGHDWYPIECCHAMDCAPIDSMTTLPQPVIAGMAGGSQLPMTVVKTMHGEAVIPPNFPIRESKDGRSHACIRGGHLICLFLAPEM